MWDQPYAGDNAVHKVISELRQAFNDDPHNPGYIATIRKRGYRLVASVVRSTAEIEESTLGSAEQVPNPRRWVRWGGLGVVLLALLIGAMFFSTQSLPPLSYPPARTHVSAIAVLKFQPANRRTEQIGVGLANAIMRALFQVGVQIPSPVSGRRLESSDDR